MSDKNFCFILASITGREHLLNDFVNSVKNSKYNKNDFYLYFQNVAENTSTGEYDKSLFKNVYISNSRDGTCLPKMYWLHNLNNYDFYILIDDDMEFLGKEDYETAMGFVANVKECGICNTECRRTLKLYNEYEPQKKLR